MIGKTSFIGIVPGLYDYPPHYKKGDVINNQESPVLLFLFCEVFFIHD
jgi:hypothetical protein